MNPSIYYCVIFFTSLGSILLIFNSRAFSFLDEQKTECHRASGLDGLRFLLASFVVFHHIDCFHNFFLNGKWAPSQYYLWALGKYGVALFFMTTAYLFWGKIRSKDDIDWIELYTGRVCRIAPMALFSATIAVVAITIYSSTLDGFYFNLANALSWFDASVFEKKLAFTNFNTPFVAMAGVTWSLKWEWMFYFLLPLAFIFRRRGLEFAITVCAISFYILPTTSANEAYIWSYFASGILCKELSSRICIDKNTANAMVVFALAFLFMSEPGFFSVSGTPLIAIIFFCVISGADLFGLLTLKSSLRLGTISYSIYIMQGVVLFPLFIFTSKYNLLNFSFATAMLMILFYIVLCVICSITYVCIEKRFMRGLKSTTQLYNQPINKLLK